MRSAWTSDRGAFALCHVRGRGVGSARALVLSTLAALVAGCAAPAIGAAPSPRWKPALDALLEHAFATDEPGGVVLVAQGGEPVYLRSFGLADLERGSALRPDSVFGVGSITKQFTAVAILKLVDDGRVSLDADVRSYVPGAPTEGRRVTIEQLLTHTSGLPNLIDVEGFEAWARQDRSVDELLARTAGVPLEFEPGAGYAYSDSGYILLGAVIERVSGQTIGEFLDDLLRPLGLSSTVMGGDSRLAARLAPRRASGYTVRDGRVEPADPISLTVPHAAGALLSTAEDFLRWHVALTEGRVVHPCLLERAWTPRTLPDGTLVGYGFGWNLCTIDGHRTFEHGGWINGYTAKAVHLPDDDLAAIVLVNRDAGDPEAGSIARRVLRIVLHGSPELPVVTLTPEQRIALVGDYRFSDGSLRMIRDEGGRMTSQRHGGPLYSLLALSPSELSFEFGEGTVVLRFELDDDGSPAARARSVRSLLHCAPRDIAVRDVEGAGGTRAGR